MYNVGNGQTFADCLNSAQVTATWGLYIDTRQHATRTVLQ